MTYYVLDTNMVTFFIGGDPQVRQRFHQHLSPDNTFLGCPVVWHELYRGLLAKDAKGQMQHLQQVFADFVWQDYVREDWTLASSLWAQRRAQGRPIADADLFIAAFARNRNAVLVTDNEKDFADLGVTVENWIKA